MQPPQVFGPPALPVAAPAEWQALLQALGVPEQRLRSSAHAQQKELLKHGAVAVPIAALQAGALSFHRVQGALSPADGVQSVGMDVAAWGGGTQAQPCGVSLFVPMNGIYSQYAHWFMFNKAKSGNWFTPGQQQHCFASSNPVPDARYAVYVDQLAARTDTVFGAHALLTVLPGAPVPLAELEECARAQRGAWALCSMTASGPPPALPRVDDPEVRHVVELLGCIASSAAVAAEQRFLAAYYQFALADAAAAGEFAAAPDAMEAALAFGGDLMIASLVASAAQSLESGPLGFALSDTKQFHYLSIACQARDLL